MKRRAMYSRWRNVAPVALAVALAACSGSHPAPVTTDGAEASEMSAPVARYKDQGLMGADVKATTLQVSADAEKWSELDEQTEAALKARLMDAWVQTWKKHHRGAHATLTVRFHNYYGEEIAAISKRA